MMERRLNGGAAWTAGMAKHATRTAGMTGRRLNDRAAWMA